MLGSRSIRFHYNKASKLNSTARRRKDEEVGELEAGHDGAADDDGDDGVNGSASGDDDGSGAGGLNGTADAEAGEKGGRRYRKHRNRAMRETGVKGGRGLQGQNEKNGLVDADKQV